MPRARSLRSARSVWLCAIGCALAAAPLAARAQPTTPEAGCTASHELRDGEMRLRATCPVPLAESSRALTELLLEKYPGGRMTDARATLEIGRIAYHPWLSKGLAEAGLRSPVWDADRGRGLSGGDNAAVASMIDARKLLQAWQPVFMRFGARARAGSVEKVLVGKVGKTDELAPLAKHAAAAGKKLPFDAILWIRLEPLPRPY